MIHTVRFRILVPALMLLQGCTSYFFYPMKEQFMTPDVMGVSYQDLELPTPDGLVLHGWKLYAETEPHATVLYLHGNAENISTHFGNVFWMTEHGYDVLLFDYRGYGLSDGQAELDGIVSDAARMIDYAVQHDKTGRLIVMGQSLGASLSIYALATSEQKHRVSTLVSVAGFSDYHDVAQDVLSRSWLTWLLQVPLRYSVDNTYSPVEVVDELAPVPLLIMHGRADRIIEFYHAERLIETAREPKLLVEIEGGHNSSFSNEHNRQLLLDYLDSL